MLFRSVIVVGADGGTGAGVALPLAIAARQVAREYGWNVELRIHYLAGNYHPPRDDDENRRKHALAQVFTDDLEIALNDVSARWQFPVGTGRYWTHSGVLFDKAFRLEANERLANSYEACLCCMARTLHHLYCTEAGYRLERLWSNEIPHQFFN